MAPRSVLAGSTFPGGEVHTNQPGVKVLSLLVCLKCLIKHLTWWLYHHLELYLQSLNFASLLYKQPVLPEEGEHQQGCPLFTELLLQIKWKLRVTLWCFKGIFFTIQTWSGIFIPPADLHVIQWCINLPSVKIKHLITSNLQKEISLLYICCLKPSITLTYLQ